MSRIPSGFIDELMARTDIVEVVNSRVPLKRAGSEFKACCPFHGEKTPSFTVSPTKQFFHCFGCGAHGTALGFLMDYEHMSFPEAVEELATLAGLEVPREAAPGADSGPDLHGTLEAAATYYREQLAHSPPARDYLSRRGVSAESIARFGIGYAPDEWDALTRRLGRDEEARRRLAAAGLVVERDSGGCYDRFRGRVMFPIRDARGRVTAFGGRIIGDGEPKYLNSPETPLFHKGQELYGLYEARQALREIPRLMVVEGYMDAVGLHQAGLPWSVATLGTATTRQHLDRLFRLTDEVVFCFDGDRAGRQAAWRALETALPALREGRQVRFLFLPEGEDPDSLVGKEGADAFTDRLADSLPLSEYLLAELSRQADTGNLDGRARLAELAKPLVARVPDGVFRALLVRRIAAAVDMPEGEYGRFVASAVPPQRAAIRPAKLATRAVAGRSSLVRRSIALVVHFPAVAAAVRVPEGLGGLDRPGISLLVELLEDLSGGPHITTGQLLERWRDREGGAHLHKLAIAEMLTDEQGAGGELQDCLDRLAAEAIPLRQEAILAQGGRLSDDQKAELRRLHSELARIKGAKG
jgi:DNA primase